MEGPALLPLPNGLQMTEIRKVETVLMALTQRMTFQMRDRAMLPVIDYLTPGTSGESEAVGAEVM